MIIEDIGLRNLFFNSADNYLKILTENLLLLEKEPNNIRSINEAFRAAHSFKSESLTMGYQETGALCHAIEDIFGIYQKDQAKKIDTEAVSELLIVVDELTRNIQSVKNGKPEFSTKDMVENVRLLTNLVLEGKKKDENAQSGKDGINKISAKEDKSKHKDDKISDQKPAVADSINVRTEILDNLMNLMEEFIILKLQLENAIEEQSLDKVKDFKKRMEVLLTELQYSISQARLVPIGQIFENFPRLVRDMAKEQGKIIDFEMKGLDIRIDRTIADRLVEPLVHLIRNSVDHGIEKPEERQEHGKSTTGRIVLTARREKDRAVIEITDDGRGFDFNEIKKEVQKNTKTGNQDFKNIPEGKLLTHLYQGGISTSKRVTTYSGRGMGLYSVKSAMDFLGGSLRLDTEARRGTLFVLEFPLSLAIIKALLVEVNHEKFAIPTINIIQSIRLDTHEVKKAADLDTFILADEEIPVLDLGEKFFSKASKIKDAPLYIVVVGQVRKKIGFLVSRILGMENITVKSLTQFSIVGKEFSGATVMGDGKVALIIDVPAIFNDF